MTYHYESHELAHSTHPHTCSRGDPSKPKHMWVQDGWHMTFISRDVMVRSARMVKIQPEWDAKMAETCQYSNHRTDPACKHCSRRES